MAGAGSATKGPRRPGNSGRKGRGAKQTYLGLAGEDAAVRQLEAMGMAIVERNYRCRLGEVDVIARDGDTVCFIEVKARRTGAFGGGLEAVAGRKRVQVRRVATYYLTRFGDHLPACRFDAAEVWLDPEGKPERVRVVKNAF